MLMKQLIKLLIFCAVDHSWYSHCVIRVTHT